MNSNSSSSSEDGRFLSTDCIDAWLEGPADHTVRPIPEYRRAHAKAELEKILAEAETAASKKSSASL